MPRRIQPGEQHTYDEWIALGYQVQRGEHHVGRNEVGACVFSPDQVRPRNTAPVNPNAYQQRPRRVRRAEVAERPPPVEVQVVYPPTSGGFGTFRTFDFEAYRSLATASQTYGEYFGTFNSTVALNRADAWHAYDPRTDPDVSPVLEAQRAYQKALDAQKALERQAKRKYIPADDQSSAGFKKLCAIERSMKKEK
jgi:hypothetical protein